MGSSNPAAPVRGLPHDRAGGAWPVVVPGALVVLLGGLALLGWYLRVAALVQVVPEWPPMARNTAAAMVLAGAALVGLGRGRSRLRLLGVAGLVIGALTLAGHAFGIDLRIDHALLPDPWFIPGVTSLRMAPNTAVALMLVGLGLLPSPTGRRHQLAVAALTGCGSPVVALGLVTTFSYVFSVPAAYGWGAHQSMPVPTAVCCLLLGSGMIMTSRRASEGSARPSWPVAPLLVGGVLATLLLWWSFALLLERNGSRTIAVGTASNAIVLIGAAFSALLAIAVDLGRRAAQRAQEASAAQELLTRQAAELRASEARYRALVRNFPIGSVVLYDHDLRFLVADGAGLTQTGLTPERLVGHTISEVVPAELSAVIEPAMRAALQGESRQTEVSIAGRIRRLYLVPIHDGTGQVQTGMIMSQDVTVERQAEAAIRQAHEQLERHSAELQASNTELEAFSYSVSHDLRAPLRAMTGFSRILVEEHGPALPAKAREYIELIQRSATHMGQLIDHLLAFSRLQRQPLQRVEHDLAEIVTDAWDRLASERNGRQAELRLGELPRCQADPRLLEHVLANLLENALKFTRTRPVAIIEVGTCDHDGASAYYVRDNGVGFDMRYADKLFKVFQRLHDTADYEGTGIGLALVQRIISRHGGQIWADSHQGHGTTFYFTLGRATADDGDLHADPAGGRRPQRHAPDHARA
jgi:PAS domain S-box-containing protein